MKIACLNQKIEIHKKLISKEQISEPIDFKHMFHMGLEDNHVLEKLDLKFTPLVISKPIIQIKENSKTKYNSKKNISNYNNKFKTKKPTEFFEKLKIFK